MKTSFLTTTSRRQQKGARARSAPERQNKRQHQQGHHGGAGGGAQSLVPARLGIAYPGVLGHPVQHEQNRQQGRGGHGRQQQRRQRRQNQHNAGRQRRLGAFGLGQSAGPQRAVDERKGQQAIAHQQLTQPTRRAGTSNHGTYLKIRHAIPAYK